MCTDTHIDGTIVDEYCSVLNEVFFFFNSQTIVELAETGSLDLSIFCSTCLVVFFSFSSLSPFPSAVAQHREFGKPGQCLSLSTFHDPPARRLLDHGTGGKMVKRCLLPVFLFP